MKNKGLTGWLDPSGVFHPCRYGKHSVLAMEVMDSDYPYTSCDRLKEDHNYIPMGVCPDGDSYVFLNIDQKQLKPIITDEQIKWFEQHLNELDDEQKEMVLDWLEDTLSTHVVTKKE